MSDEMPNEIFVTNNKTSGPFFAVDEPCAKAKTRYIKAPKEAPTNEGDVDENVSECIGEIFGSAWNFDLPEDHPQNQNLNDHVDFIRNHISNQAAEIEDLGIKIGHLLEEQSEKDKRIAELNAVIRDLLLGIGQDYQNEEDKTGISLADAIINADQALKGTADDT